MFSGPIGEARDLRARSPDRKCLEWSELYTDPHHGVTSRRLASGAGHLRIPQWAFTETLEPSIDAALEEFRGAPGLIVDLRGNPGGRVQLATAFRDRFLPESVSMGCRRFSRPGGALGPASEIRASPAETHRRWTQRVRFLTDPLTYSACEDLLLGLQGLPHVEVVGQPSGGGSGQARSLRLLPGWRFTVSSCLTYDRSGVCIEAVGIPVDRYVPSGHLGVMDDTQLLSIAEAW